MKQRKRKLKASEVQHIVIPSTELVKAIEQRGHWMKAEDVRPVVMKAPARFGNKRSHFTKH